ncbi:MAG: hypothetical protein ABIE42_10215 [Candidatus Eisenbacteria bacterium]
MQITIPYEFMAQEVPYRCHKPRGVRKTAAITLTIHEVTAAAAPIAIRQTSGKKTIYRWWRNRLWMRERFRRASGARWETQTVRAFLADPYPFSAVKPVNSPYWNASQSDRRRALLAWGRTVLFIDGQRWTMAGEPRYVVMTFGLGCNHGLGWGTSLSTDNGYNSNIGHPRYFRCDDYEGAEAAATHIAQSRGDTKALPISKQRPARFDVLIPAAVRLCPAKEHGQGCTFINSVERLIESVQNPLIAGAGAMVLALGEAKTRTS